MKKIIAISIFTCVVAYSTPFDHTAEFYWVIFEDFTGDARTDIAVASPTSAGNAGLWWFIYAAVTDGGYTYLGDLFFHPKAFRLYPKARGSELIIYLRSNSESGSLVTYLITEEILEIEKEDIFPKIEDRVLYENHFSYLWKYPRVLKIPANQIRFDGESISLKDG